ncbi:MAG: T9SS type A sorting domain-containing protein [bacterium]|nr:T9SS type A sorting domain-containing protein [bacterium]
MNQVFIGIVGAKSLVGYSQYLGTLFYDVPDSEELELTEDDFELLVGDVLLPGGGAGVLQGVSMEKSEEVKHVYHNFLAQNHPNPFNPQTTITYSLEQDSKVNLTIYSVSGERVRVLEDDHQGRGVYRVVWDGRDDRGKSTASGVYFYRLTAGDFTATKKMVLLR